MIKTERQMKIMEILRERKFCTVNELAKMLFVSQVTVRRDLNLLESASLAKRCHGGVTLFEQFNHEVPVEVRKNSNSSVKAQLAKQAIRHLNSGDTVFIDASSTALHLCELITKDMNLTVITNSITVLERLREKRVKCYCTGGMLLENSNALAGSIAENCIRSMYADVLFFSTQGISENGEITDYSEEETRLRSLMIEHAKKSVYIFDSSKFGKRYLFKQCDAHDIDYIISDCETFFN